MFNELLSSKPGIHRHHEHEVGFRQDLLEQETDVPVRDAVVLDAPVEARLRRIRRRRHHARVDEDADRHRHLTAVDQVVEHMGRAVGPVPGEEGVALFRELRRRGVPLRFQGCSLVVT